MSIEKKNPTVVVVIPYYNGADWIERAIKSVVTQTVQPDEFVIVNDGSKLEERAALGLLAEKYPFRIIDKENGGQGSARNAGIAATNSDYISLLDQDDYYLPNHIKDLVHSLPKDDPRLGYVYADLCEADGPGNIVHSNMLRQQPGSHPKQGHVLYLLRNDMFVLPSASLIYRPAFEAISGFDEQFMGYEDDDLFLRMFRSGYTNYFLDKPVTAWCMHSGSTSWSIKMSRSRFKYFKKLTSQFPDDDEKSIYYFRDCLVPRFGPAFILDAMKALKKDDKNKNEIFTILRQYRDIVCSNSNISSRQKRNIRIKIYLLTEWPAPLVKILSSTLKLRGFQRIARIFN